MARTKVKLQAVRSDYHIEYSRLDTSPTSSTYISGKLNSADSSTTCVSTITTGDNIPNWKWLISQGLDATTTMDGTIERAQYRRGHLYARHELIYNPDPRWTTVWQYTGEGHFTPIGAFSGSESVPLSTTTAANRALARFNDKAANVNRQFQGGVVLAEIAKTLHGIRHPAEALFKGIETYSRAATKLRTRFVKNRASYLSLSKARRREVAKSFSKAAAGLWLEKTFHWTPLMYDIQGGISALEHTFDQMPRTFVKASGTEVVTEAHSVTHNGTSYIDMIESYSVKTGATVRMYGSVRVRPRLPFWPDTTSLGFDIKSFVPGIWELIPYSWAIDYFTNIGDILYGMSQGGSEVAWSAQGSSRWVKRGMITTTGFTVDALTPVPDYTTKAYILGSPSELLSEHAVIHRASYTGNYIPELEWRVPGLSLKWLNLGAAFLQRSLGFL